MNLTEEVNARVERLAAWYIETVKRHIERMREKGVPVFYEDTERPPKEPE